MVENEERIPPDIRRVRVLYLDLDGTVRWGLDELGHFVNNPDDVRIFDGVPDLLRRYRDAGWRIVAVSNQGGVALGHMSLTLCLATMMETSIGIVADDGRELYLESADFVDETCNQWVQENVLPKLGDRKDRLHVASIAQRIIGFVGHDHPEFWGYYCDYDWVVLCQLFGTMMDLPNGWPMYCNDLCQAIGRSIVLPVQHDEHHALADARWIREAYRMIEL